MPTPVHAYEFTEPALTSGSDPLVCVVSVAQLKRYMSVSEINHAFSGFATYRRLPWLRPYVGVWGRKNCQRLRRFLRERGAEVILFHEKPDRLRLANYRTGPARRYVRTLLAR